MRIFIIVIFGVLLFSEYTKEFWAGKYESIKVNHWGGVVANYLPFILFKQLLQINIFSLSTCCIVPPASFIKHVGSDLQWGIPKLCPIS